jgi:hypothetical protein
MWLACTRSTFSLIAVRIAGLTQKGNVLREAPISVPLHRNALRMLSITRLGANAELLMQKDQLVIELASCLR